MAKLENVGEEAETVLILEVLVFPINLRFGQAWNRTQDNRIIAQFMVARVNLALEGLSQRALMDKTGTGLCKHLSFPS